MAVKTITVTETAYYALKSLKAERESFSETILRVAKKRPLGEFFGILSKETAVSMEKSIREMRKERNEAHRRRMTRIVKGMETA